VIAATIIRAETSVPYPPENTVSQARRLIFVVTHVGNSNLETQKLVMNKKYIDCFAQY
jgi:hypothetical protein